MASRKSEIRKTTAILEGEYTSNLYMNVEISGSICRCVSALFFFVFFCFFFFFSFLILVSHVDQKRISWWQQQM